MSILTRYLLRMHVGPFFFALSVLTGLLFVNVVARRFEELAGKGLGFRVIGEVFLLSLPHIIALTLPMAVLVAVLYAFSVLAADNEITAMKSTGINLVRLMAPLVFVSVLLAGGMVWFNDVFLPNANHRLATLLMDIGRKSPTLQLKEQVINPIQSFGNMRSKYYLQSAQIDPATNRLQDVVIYDLSLGQKARTIYADSGRMAFNESRSDLLLVLHDGWVHEVDTYDASKFRRIDFQQQQLVMQGVGNQLERMEKSYRGDREMSIGMLAAQADSARARLAEINAEAARQSEIAVKRALAGPLEVEGLETPRTIAPSAGGALASVPAEYVGTRQVSTPDQMVQVAAIELEVARVRARTEQQIINLHTVEYHKKFAIPFACIVFVLIGAPLAVRFPRGGVGMVIAISLTIFGIYYMSLIGGESLGDRGIVPPFAGPWGPNAVFSLIAVYGLTQIGKETSTTRGGGWGDLYLTIRRLVTRPFRRRARRRAHATASAR